MTIDTSGEWWKGSNFDDFTEYIKHLTEEGYPADQVVQSICSCGNTTLRLVTYPMPAKLILVERRCAYPLAWRLMCEALAGFVPIEVQPVMKTVANFKPSVEIVEYYEDYEPPIDATKVTRKLIDNIPQKYLLGLGKIVITNRSRLTQRELHKKTKSRKRKVSMTNVRGLYHYQTGASPAWVEIFIDQISDLKLSFFQKIPLFRELSFSKVLYHEIGHHIHTVVRPEHSREREDIADEWQQKLWGHYVRKKYWYLAPLLWVLRWIVQTKVVQNYNKKLTADIIEQHRKSKTKMSSEKSS